MSESIHEMESPIEIIQYLNGIVDGVESEEDIKLQQAIYSYSQKIQELIVGFQKIGKQVYFVRHGQTDRNIKSIMNPGDFDSLLNATGLSQAEYAGEQMKELNIPIKYVGTSDLQRSLETSQTIATLSNNRERTGKSTSLYGFREMFGGVFRDTPVKDLEEILAVNDSETLRRFYKAKKYNQIESVIEFDYRVTKALYKYLSSYVYPDGNILIGGHSGTSRVFKRIIEGGKFSEVHYRGGSISNSVVYELDAINNKLVQITEKLILN